MTGQEILVYLINKGIIHTVGDSYFPTSKVQELMSNLDKVSTLDISVPKVIEVSKLYPESIRNVGDDKKLTALQNYCDVPVSIDTGRSNYLVRSSDFATRTTVLKILSNPDFSPAIVLQVIKDYYSGISTPKSFKNFIKDDFEAIYLEYLDGETIDPENKPDNKTLL
jgi:hypothetical protein